ncbi:MAG: ECF transporter S component [Clostridia bacterium]|nr:ECF transporter S component [Clostridia bacterium]
MKNAKKQIQFIAVNGILAAIVCIVSFLPIRTLGLEITLSMVPVAIGAALYGPLSGALLGGVFGVVSFLQCLGYSPFGAILLSIDPVKTSLVCIPTRILAGLLAGLFVLWIKKATHKSGSFIAFTVGCVAAPVLNTVFFMSTLCLCFYNTEFIQGFVTTLGASNPATFILLFVGVNGLVEILCGTVLALPLAKALSKAVK